ncbi:hypothetical protein Pan216_52510 [Planctomycetes bacterium Pan216]|uniref:Uncharacterized protein n=1 Tax=Kolteria novifilia TaxID=2527975 RepID=A0A518BBJ9_9BACT|nr:hypothetical protein Pan216_52510 [Planctomycetes bacterium Pan216]
MLGCSRIDPEKFAQVFDLAESVRTATPAELPEHRARFERELKQLEQERPHGSERTVMQLLRQASSQWMYADLSADAYHRSGSAEERQVTLRQWRSCMNKGAESIGRARRLVMESTRF